MPFNEDLRPFFNPAEFGITATFRGTLPVNGILDLAYLEPLQVQGGAPVFTCAAADVPDVAHGDALDAGGRSYKVVGVEPDGSGVVLLRLERQ